MFASIVNALAIILAGLLGILLGQRFPERMQESLMKVCGLSVIFIGIDGAVKGLAKNDDFLFVIISLALRTLIGEWIDIDRRFETLGEYLKKKTGSQKDGGFTDAFVTVSFTVCIGAMAVVGSLEAGLAHNFSILYTKSILDFVIILVMASSMGKGALFSFLPVFLLQGSITLLASALSPLFSEAVLDSLSLVGNILIFCVGINLLFGKTIRVSNTLPALLVAMIWALWK